MIYTHKLLIPEKTYADSPEHQIMKVTKGLVYKVEFHFPPGCRGLVHMVVFDGGHQVWPSTLGELFVSEAYCISFDDSYLKLIPPFQFDFYGFNLDDTLEHTVYCRIGLVSKEIFMARFLPTVAYEYFLELMRKEEEKQKEQRRDVLKEPFPWLK